MAELAIFLIRAVSSFFLSIGGRACRFHPSCSAYSTEAFRRFSFTRASGLTARRVLSCHPFHAGGYDPLPARES
ncbi:MAG TPA: membrane protein insertion efficiency factor YidD [Candidatus Eisenbacteria bacterium]|nr:membrane protein insertion efficiency factor YidD [Candidatus Eisenbacteria bacterium]